MIRVIIGNSISKVLGLTPPQLKILRHMMSYLETTPKRDYRRGHKLMYTSDRIHLMNDRGVFPTGLLYLVRDFQTKQNVAIDVEDTRVAPKALKDWPQLSFKASGIVPRQEQIDAAGAVAERARGIISAPTGSGKSVIIALICYMLKVPTLIVVPSLGLRAQLTESLKEWFGNKNVGRLSDRPLIAVENVDALNPKKPLKGYPCVIIDEFHHSAAKTYQDLNLYAWNDVYLRAGMTATPYRSKSEERLLLESVLSEIIYKLDYHTAVTKGYIVPLEAFVVNIPKKNTGSRKKVGYKSYNAAYKDLVVQNEEYNKIVASVAMSLEMSGKAALVITKHVAHGHAIKELMGNVPFIKGENDNNVEIIKDFNELVNPVIIGTEGCVGEGVDTKSCEYILDAGGGKSKPRFLQKCGRSMRVYTHPVSGPKQSGKLIMFRYADNAWLNNHYLECVKHLQEEYGIEPIEIKF